MEATLTIVRIVILTVLSGIVLLCAAAWWKRTADRLWIIPPLSWALLGMTLYILVLRGGMSSRAFGIWAGVLWLSTCFLVLGGVWLFLWPARRR